MGGSSFKNKSSDLIEKDGQFKELIRAHLLFFYNQLKSNQYQLVNILGTDRTHYYLMVMS